MNQLQVFIILNILPILFLVGIILVFLKSKEKKLWKKIGLFFCILCIAVITYKSFEIHKALFPYENKEITCRTGGFAITTGHSKPAGFSFNDKYYTYSGIFNVQSKPQRILPLCANLRQENQDKE